MIQKDKKPYQILVIEDNPGDFLIVEEFLADQILAPVIVHANNFKEASAALSAAQSRFDVILLDLSLPDKSGQQLVTDMLRIAAACPVIILTGYTDIDFSIKSISQGILDYLLKDDMTAVSLYKSILYAIERKKAIAELTASEKRYSDLFHLSPQPMCLYEQGSFRFMKINKAAIDHFGYSEAEFLQMTLLDLVQDDDKQNALNTVVNQNRQLNVTYQSKTQALKKSGEKIEVETFSTPILLNGQVTTLLIAIDVTEKNLYAHKITKAIIKTQEDERYEIGGELHDNVCQILAASLMSLGMMKSLLPAAGLQWYDQCNKYINLATLEIRNLSHRLAPAFLNESTLEEAFQSLLNGFNIGEPYTIRLNFDEAVQQHNISLELQLNLYRILQEQLKNIYKYSKAALIEVEVVIYNNKLKMRIADDGVGFDVATVKSGIGLANMKRRAELFSGKMEIHSSPGNGCEIITDIPLLQTG
jgi:PAS domain S-box-containing protein